MESDMKHLPSEALEAGLPEIRRAPADRGVVELIVARPDEDQRQILPSAALDLENGLVGDNWRQRMRRRKPEGEPFLENQLTLMNARVAALVSGDKSRWPLAGDQLFVDFDLSSANIPPGTRLGIGTAVIEVSALPHTGCKKFVSRFGMAAMEFVNSAQGKALNLRGINARVIQAGEVRTGDEVHKLA